MNNSEIGQPRSVPAEKKPLPNGWGEDSLSRFIDCTIDNTFHTFLYDASWFAKMREVDDAFGVIGQNLNNTKEIFPPFFIPRAHSAYLAAVRLAMSGQLAEGYMCLRGCLENALYSFHIHRKSDDAELYLRREEDEKTMKDFKKRFRPSAFLDELGQVDAQVAEVAKALYERSIEYGAHPNPKGMLMGMEITRESKRTSFTSEYLIEDATARKLCMKTAAQTGVCSLDIFRLTLKERFDLLLLTDRLNELRKGL